MSGNRKRFANLREAIMWKRYMQTFQIKELPFLTERDENVYDRDLIRI
jgi:hypothetical protein